MHTTQIAFRKATTADLEEAWTLLDTARNLMLTNGRKQWTKDYPSRELIENDIAGGDAYILTVDGEVAAYAKLAVNGEPEYAHLEGSWLSEQDYVVIHRLAVSPRHRGHGLSKRLFHEAEKWAALQGAHSIKVDTNYDNVEMLNILPHLGYTYCGQIHYGAKGDRKAFEKLISSNI